MSWDDLSDVERKLTAVLQRFDWEAADGICKEIVDRLPSEEEAFPETSARALLRALRRKRRFAAMGLVAEAFLQAGIRNAQVQRQYGQALIDQGILTAAECYLQQLIKDPGTIPPEKAEAHGLMGRIYKQIFVNEAGKANPSRARATLQRSFNEYGASYSADPKACTWHGINMVALLARAEKDKIALNGAMDYKELAATILQTLAEKEAAATNGVPAFDLATEMEAYVALGQFDKASRVANRYVAADDADDFEISGTLRQLLEPWQLTDEKPPGSTLLPILRAAQLRKEGGGMTVPIQQARRDLEKVFGNDRSVSLKWYQDGLRRSQSVCRVETADGKGFGTGFLVNSKDFFPSQLPRPLVLTNAHVVSTTYATAIRPPLAWVNFQMLDKRLQMKCIVCSSPVEELDFTFLDLADALTCDPASLFPAPLEMAEPGPRMYIIGHPGGRDLEFSLNDNRLIACNAEKLHYRTPTEGGSSGSPIFDPVGWQVVGLHHAGQMKMPKLNGPLGESYEANEGISILAIQKKTRSFS